jgi:hypothetical protein
LRLRIDGGDEVDEDERGGKELRLQDNNKVGLVSQRFCGRQFWVTSDGQGGTNAIFGLAFLGLKCKVEKLRKGAGLIG